MPDPVEMIAKTLRHTHPQLSPGSIQMLAEGLAEIADRAVTKGWNLTKARLVLQGNRGTNPVGDLLRQVRLAKGLTQKQAAEVTDFSPVKILRIENGLVTVTLNDVRGMIMAYGVSEEEGQKLLNCWREHKRTTQKPNQAK